MRPRPRSRLHPVEYVPPEVLADEIHAMRARGVEPEGIIVGRREWDLIRCQPEARPFLFAIIAEEPIFDGVPVMVRPRAARPMVCSRADLEEALQESRNRRG